MRPSSPSKSVRGDESGSSNQLALHFVAPKELVHDERPLCGVGSTDRRNTFCELLSWGLIEQGLSRPFIELPCDRAELGLAMQGQIGAPRKILAQQSVGVFA